MPQNMPLVQFRETARPSYVDWTFITPASTFGTRVMRYGVEGRKKQSFGERSSVTPSNTTAPADDSPPEPVAKAITCFENQVHRMDYPSYTQRGLWIGSSSAESAVERVVGTRLNQAGMRWNPEHAEAVARVRAAILGNHWDDFWSDFRPSPRQYQRKELPLAA